MNRPIKFRAWCNRTKEFVKGEKYGLLLNGKHVARSQYNEVGAQMAYTENSALDLSVMQFTGLTDKNGKEIYEGDIIESFVLLSETGENIRTVVKWGENGWLANGALSNNPQWMNNHQPEVIGNIYENPELLGV